MTAKPIPDSEYAERLARVRAELGVRGFDALMAYGAHRDYKPGDLRYLARWYCVEEETSVLFVPQSGPTTLLTDVSWDVDRAKAEAYADEVRFSEDLGADLADLAVQACGPEPHLGVAGYEIFPLPVYLRVVDRIPRAVISDASDLTVGLRIVKSRPELEVMRAASRISDEAMAAGLAEIRAGATELEVAAAAERVIRAAGAEPSFVTLMGGGARTAIGAVPTARPLVKGEFAMLDCGARLYGYHGDMCRTVVVGEPTAGQERKLRAVAAAVEAAISAVRPGVTVGDVHDAAEEAVTEAGYGQNWWDAFMPHGNGAAQHESPNAREHPHLPLEEGMVLCIEPGIVFADEGVICIEQMIAVTADGAEVLNHLPVNMWGRHEA